MPSTKMHGTVLSLQMMTRTSVEEALNRRRHIQLLATMTPGHAAYSSGSPATVVTAEETLRGFTEATRKHIANAVAGVVRMCATEVLHARYEWTTPIEHYEFNLGPAQSVVARAREADHLTVLRDCYPCVSCDSGRNPVLAAPCWPDASGTSPRDAIRGSLGAAIGGSTVLDGESTERFSPCEPWSSSRDGCAHPLQDLYAVSEGDGSHQQRTGAILPPMLPVPLSASDKGCSFRECDVWQSDPIVTTSGVTDRGSIHVFEYSETAPGRKRGVVVEPMFS